jgi:hypothetical protein
VLDQQLISVALDWLEANSGHKDADFVFNRVLRMDNLSTSDWNRAARVAMGWIRGQNPDAPFVDHAVNSLLKNAQLLNLEDLQSVIQLATKLPIETLAEDAADRFLVNLQKGKSFLASGDEFIEQANQTLLRLGAATRFRTILSRLLDMAADVALAADEDFLIEACEIVEARANDSPRSAGLAIPALLVLGCRAGDRLLSKVGLIVKKVLSDRRLHDRGHDSIVVSCQQLLDVTGYSSYAAATSLLQRDQ